MSVHIPVMLNNVMKMLLPQDGKTYIDATFGAGGYSRAILRSADCSVIAFDRDSDTEKFALEIAKLFPNKLHYFNSRFSLMEEVINTSPLKGVEIDGIVFDLGVSSMQLAEGDRGFSFMHDGPLDMRMSTEDNLITAAVIVNGFYEKKIADIIFEYGGEFASRKIAKAIVHARSKQSIKTTHELGTIIRSVFPNKHYRINPATKTFQAIRMFVNSEMQELERGLAIANKLVANGGRVVTVSFHSLEDGMVKNTFRDWKHGGNFELLNKKVVTPSDEEIKDNLRSRSAKLRAVVKINKDNL